jgi:hypothetical protein
MKESYAVVLCLSQETEARDTAGIYPEALDAIGYYRKHKPGGIFLIPVRLNECEIPPIDIDAVRTLDSLQRADLFPPSRRGEGLQRLIQALRAAHPRPDGTAPSPLEVSVQTTWRELAATTTAGGWIKGFFSSSWRTASV